MNEITKKLPQRLFGSELKAMMTNYPNYDPADREKSPPERQDLLSVLYDIYVPSEMSLEIYGKLYFCMKCSLDRKFEATQLIQGTNRRLSDIIELQSVAGGKDSFSIIGAPGIGKTQAVKRSVALFSENGLIEIKKPYTVIAPYIMVEVPSDCSVKSLIRKMINAIDSKLGTSYSEQVEHSRITTNGLISLLSRLCKDHVGLIIIDEIEYVIRRKEGLSIVNFLTELTNSTGVGICLIGTPECKIILYKTEYLARRTFGLHYDRLEYNDYFQELCHTLFQYQYTKIETTLNETILDWIYQHSGGSVSNIVALIVEAQDLAIQTGSEKLDLNSLKMAYDRRLESIKRHIDPYQVYTPRTSKPTSIKTLKKRLPKINEDKTVRDDTELIIEAIKRAKTNNGDLVEILKGFFAVEEISTKGAVF